MNELLNLNVVWFVLVGVLFTGYVVLDGFDLGVGTLHLFAKTDEERRLSMNAIGPVWDGNEVWLVTGGGALFAAFPEVYATVFSGFYLAFILLLCGLIFRAVSIEFRSKLPMPWWRKMWDIGFTAGSAGSAFLIGVAMGNIAWGIPLDANHEFTGSFLSLLHPYALMMGVTTVALFAMHGAIYLAMKTEDAFHERIRRWIPKTVLIFAVCYAVVTTATWIWLPHMTEIFRTMPVFWLLPLLNVLAIVNIPRAVGRQRDFPGFLSSCAAIVLLMAIFGLGMFPNLVFSVPVENSLHIYNAASSQKTLGIMLIIALIGMPLVAAYTISIYWVFRGKVKLDSSSY